MSDFIFKVPELQEDAFLKRRKLDVSREKDNRKNGDVFSMGSGNISRIRLMNNSKTGDCYRLRPLREDIEEDLAKPSTSRFVNDKSINVFQGSFGNLGNQSACNTNVAARCNHFLDNKMRANDHSFNNIKQQNMSCLMFTNKLSRCNSNLSSISLYNPYPIYNPNLTNVNAKCNNFSGKNQCNYFNHPKCLNNNEPCSSVNTGKSVFSSKFLPERDNIKHLSINRSMNKISAKFSTYETLNEADILQKESMCQLDASQSALGNQAIMKSVLQTSVFSMKEQIMNILENFGHTLLRNAPDMEHSFFKVAKDVKGIFENSFTYMNQVTSATEMSALNYSSNAIGVLQCQYQVQEPSKRPCNILQEIHSGQNEMHKVEFVNTFTVGEKKLRDSSKDTLDENLNFNSPLSKATKSKEVNLRNWYPIALQDGLAFSGLNDENVEFQTETVKRRINNRKVLLMNGIFCNLIGKGDPDGKLPSYISEKLKNGLTLRWRVLKGIIADFQKELQENRKITSIDISSVGKRENSQHTFRQSNNNRTKQKIKKNRANFVTVYEVNDHEACGGPDFTSPKTSKTMPQSKENDQNQNKNRKYNNKRNEELLENHKGSCSTLKKESVKRKNMDSGSTDADGSRVLHVTRSGRAVKRPGDLWFGGNFNPNNVESESKLNFNIKTKIISDSSESNVVKGASRVKRKRDILDEAAIETKKSKSAKSKNVVVQANGTDGTERLRNKKNKENSESKSLNSTSNAENKKSKKGHKKGTTKPQVNDNVDSWVNDFEDELINISELSSDGLKADIKKLRFISMETPPLKILRSHLKILRSCTPVAQSPFWIPSQHTESGVKKFEKVRAQTFRQKIPKEQVKKDGGKSNISFRSKEVDTVLNWISEREVKSPIKCSNVVKYVIPKRSELEDEEDDKEL